MAPAALHTALAGVAAVFPFYSLLLLLVAVFLGSLRSRQGRRTVPKLPGPLVVALFGALVLAVPLLFTRVVSLAGFNIAVPAVAAAIVFIATNGMPPRIRYRPRFVLNSSYAALVLLAVVSIIPSLRPVEDLLAPHKNVLAAHIAVLTFAVVYLASALENASVARTAGLLAIVLALVSVLSLSSRSAFVGIVVFMILVLITFRSKAGAPASVRTRLVVASAGLAVTVMVVLLVPTWRSLMSEAIAALRSSSSLNLVASSEDIGRPPWSVVGAQVRQVGINPNGNAVFRITKINGASASQAQTKVTLDSEEGYRLSLWVLPYASSHAGVRGWAKATDSEPDLHFSLQLGDNGAPTAQSSGPLSTKIESWKLGADGWVELSLILRLETPVGRSIWLGPTPDVRQDTQGATAEFSEFMLTAEETAVGPYMPTFAKSDAALTAASRIQIFQLAWNGAMGSPLIGNGAGSFVADQTANRQDSFAFAHAHNAILQVLYEHGLIGVIGLALMLIGLARVGGSKSPIPVWLIVAAVLVMNMTDYTLGDVNVGALFGGYLGFVAAVSMHSPRRESVY